MQQIHRILIGEPTTGDAAIGDGESSHREVVVEPVAGSRSKAGPALSICSTSTALFNQPGAVICDGNGGCIVSDCGNDCIRRIDLDTNIITTLVTNINAPGGTFTRTQECDFRH